MFSPAASRGAYHEEPVIHVVPVDWREGTGSLRRHPVGARDSRTSFRNAASARALPFDAHGYSTGCAMRSPASGSGGWSSPHGFQTHAGRARNEPVLELLGTNETTSGRTSSVWNWLDPPGTSLTDLPLAKFSAACRQLTWRSAHRNGSQSLRSFKNQLLTRASLPLGRLTRSRARLTSVTPATRARPLVDLRYALRVVLGFLVRQ